MTNHGTKHMARPRHTNPSPEALRKRRQRQRSAALKQSRLVKIILWVPKGDENALEAHARKLRHIARIPETEVPT